MNGIKTSAMFAREFNAAIDALAGDKPRAVLPPLQHALCGPRDGREDAWLRESLCQ